MIKPEELVEAFEGMDEATAQLACDLIYGKLVLDVMDIDDRFPGTARWVRQCYIPPDNDELIMSALNDLLAGFGVEGIFHPNESDKLIAEYVNQGDTYATTILRDVESGKYILTSYGDWLEAWEQEECEENDLVSCGYCSHLTPKAEEWSDSVCEACGRNVQTGEIPEPVVPHTRGRIERLHKLVCRSLFHIEPPLSYARTLKAIEILAKLVHEYPDDDSGWLWHSVGEFSECGLADLLPGVYWYCTDYHGGMSSDEYRLQCVVGEVFSPGMSSLDKDSSEYDAYCALAVLAGHDDPREESDEDEL